MSNAVKVLAVDDSSFMLTMISAYLEGTEFELAGTAKDGSEAIEQFRRLQPDIVLLDIVMPGQTGKETLQQILQVNPKATVVMVSSLGTEDAVTECLKAGAKNFLQKPFEQEGLVKFLRQIASQS